MDEARAYCHFVGERLPHDEEWQYAGQGNNPRRATPWDKTDQGGCTCQVHCMCSPGIMNATGKPPPPFVCTGNYCPKRHMSQTATIPGPTPVGSFSPGDLSWAGVADLLGNVWQYTDEFQDNHTRSACVRGGSNYRSSGSGWYFPNESDLLTHNKYFLMNPRYERAGTIGFRCAADVL